MQTKMILRPRPHYQRSFKYATARIVSFGAWENLELAGRIGDFLNLIKIYNFFEHYCSKPLITLAYFIMADSLRNM